MQNGRFKAKRILCAALVLAGVCGVAEADRPRSVYNGANVSFAQALFLKPQESTNNARAVRLAPLLVQEVTGTNRQSSAVPLPAQVFYHRGSVVLNDVAREQLTYWWFYPSATATNLVGVRLTLSTNDVPVIYEVVESGRGLRQIFVAQSLETAARREFGSPLPGRRHAIERSLSDAPAVVVSRIIDDSPDVMGPFVYLEAESHVVATLICRCTDAQFQHLAGQGLYELVPGDFSGNLPPATRLDAAHPRRLPEDFCNSSDRLSRNLRLPRDF